MMDQETQTSQRQAFPNISSRTWQHHADQTALATLQAIPGLDVLLQKLIGQTSEPSFRLIYLASAVRVSQRQFPEVHTLLQEACRILDAPYVPELYVAENPFFNCGTIGVERPFIVLNAEALGTLTDDEILCVIVRELGHCLSGHALYKTLLQILLKLSFAALQVPLGGAAFMGVIAALMEWDRKSELSADRAGLLVVQDPAVLYSLFMKMTGGQQASHMDVNEFFVQAAEYEGGGNALTGMHKLVNLALASHPFPVIRLTELQAWVNSGAYAAIMSQTYRLRDEADASQDDILANLKAASENYKEQFDTSKDAFAEAMSDMIAGLDTWSQQARQGMGSLFDLAAKFDPLQHASDPAPPSARTEAPPKAPEQDVFTALEKLRDLKQRGVLTDEEFEAQKAKLLDRL